MYTLVDNDEMSDIEERIASLGYTLPARAAGTAHFAPAVRSGNLVFVGGHGPLREGTYMKGKLGRDIDVDEGRDAARFAALNCLASLRAEIGDLGRVARIVKLFGMINAAADFTSHTEVLNGASDLVLEVFGDRGRHARAAVGMASLPMGISVELEMIAEVV